MIGCAGLIVLACAGLAIAFYLLFRSLGNEFAVMAASSGDIDSFHAYTYGVTTTITFQAARGLDLPDGPRLACDVVGPALQTTDWAGADWVIVNRAGDVMASNETPCP